jgi:hypothetical protein
MADNKVSSIQRIAGTIIDRSLFVGWTAPYKVQGAVHEGNVSINDDIQLSLRCILSARIVLGPEEARQVAAALVAAADALDAASAAFAASAEP